MSYQCVCGAGPYETRQEVEHHCWRTGLRAGLVMAGAILLALALFTWIAVSI